MIRSIQSTVNTIPDQVARPEVIRGISHFHDRTNNIIISVSSLPGSSGNVVNSRKLPKEGITDTFSFSCFQAPVKQGISPIS